MRICIVSQEYPPETSHGGIGTEAWNKARELSAAGHTVHVLSCGRRLDAVHTDDSGAGKLVVHRIPAPGESSNQPYALYDPSSYMLGYSWRVLEALERLLRDTDFDVLNFPEYAAEGFAYQLNRTEHNWRPVLVHMHGPLAMFADRQGWPDKDSRFYRVADFMEGESIRMADGLIASSANIADWATAHYGVERAAIEVIHPGVDCRGFRPLEAEEPLAERPTVLFVGNAAKSKGIWTVWEAVLRLRERYPTLRLQILGRGHELDALRRAAERAGAREALDVVGYLKDRSAIPEFYRRAHVFASPALHEVGVANVYVEAMASGCPVVAAATGGAPEAVVDGETGFLVPPRSVEATAAAIDRLLAKPELRERMGRAGRAVALERFATDRYAARVLRAYEETIRRSREILERGKVRRAGASA